MISYGISITETISMANLNKTLLIYDTVWKIMIYTNTSNIIRIVNCNKGSFHVID